MAENTFSIDFIARKSKHHQDEAYIIARITMDGDDTEISIKEKIAANQWDSKAEKVKGRTPEINAINEHINNWRLLIQNHYRALVNKEKAFNVTDLRNTILNKGVKKDKGHTLKKLFEKHEVAWKDQMGEGTMKNYPTTMKYVMNFVKDTTGKSDIHVSEIDFEFITDFAAYIPLHPLKEHDPCTINGTAKHIERFKKLMGWAKQLRWIKENQVADFSPKRKKQKPRSLKAHEFSLLERVPLTDPGLIFARDLFVFSCYTGMAYADVMSLSMTDFKVTEKGVFYCEIYRKKSEEFCGVPLLKPAVLILNKYKDDPRAIRRQKIFPYLTNQTVNRYLKILSQLVKFEFNLTYHVARHTFATVITLRNGVNIRILQQMMGHAKISTTQQYTAVDEETILLAMKPVEGKVKELLKLKSPKQQLLSIQNK